jgi:hypothetical protein
MNEAGGGAACQHCGKAQAECGWSFWLHFDALPPRWQRKLTARHAPKLVTLLQTLWPGAEVEFDSEKAPSI